jgi:hypothetical protein
MLVKRLECNFKNRISDCSTSAGGTITHDTPASSTLSRTCRGKSQPVDCPAPVAILGHPLKRAGVRIPPRFGDQNKSREITALSRLG